MNTYTKPRSVTIYHLAETFGVSRAEMAQWLVEIGLLTPARSPTRKALKHNVCRIMNGGHNGRLILWHRQRTIAAIRSAWHGPTNDRLRLRIDPEKAMPRAYRHHERPQGLTDTWITPRYITKALGKFDLDPCVAIRMPWYHATTNWTKVDDGLSRPWFGRVWLNPPYGCCIATWMKRLAEYGNGIALILARSDTVWFHDWVFSRASSLLFLRGRIQFCRPDGTPGKSPTGPSVLVAYGKTNTDALRRCGLKGHCVALRRLRRHPNLTRTIMHTYITRHHQSTIAAITHRGQAYYNENNPFCCEWLRNLIRDGLIPEGEVDDRPIQRSLSR